MRIYRLNHKKHKDAPFSGKGAALFPGRWNTAGFPVVYCATSLALAFLEVLVNAPSLKWDIAKEMFDVVKAEIEDGGVTILQPSQLPREWNTYSPLPKSSQEFGTAWLRDKKVLAISVPSAIMSEDRNIVINPEHPDFKDKCRIISQKTFLMEMRVSKLFGFSS
jgi:RES domain-containing protein